MELSLQTVSGVIAAADQRLKAGAYPTGRVWRTGFDPLDKHLTGGIRSGELVLLAGPQGLGKTTWVMQVARNVARSGRQVVVFSFEHDLESLLVRLVALEAGQLGGLAAPTINRIRATFESMDGRTGSLTERLANTESGAQAVEVVQEYADRMQLLRATGSSTGLEQIRGAIAQVIEASGESPLVVIDYLQKLHVPDRFGDDADRVSQIVEGLKDLALDHDVPVLAVVASDMDGLAAGKRMRVHNMRGSSALAYEADTVLMLNHKFDVVARHHLIYNTGNLERFKNWVVLSVEKNRNGRDGGAMEFMKRFEQARFETTGRLVTEQLVDERVFVE